MTHFNDYRVILNFSTSLRGAVSSLKNGGYENELNSGWMLEIILDQLPVEIQSKVGKKVVKIHLQLLTLQDFVPWFHAIVKAEMVVKHAKITSNPTEGKIGKQERNSGRLTSSKPTQSIPPTILSIGSPTKQKTENSV